MADAPVSGGTGARKAAPDFHGGRRSTLFRAHPADLELYGQEHRALRRCGNRQVAKICNNMLPAFP